MVRGPESAVKGSNPAHRSSLENVQLTRQEVKKCEFYFCLFAFIDFILTYCKKTDGISVWRSIKEVKTNH